jgi:surface protein
MNGMFDGASAFNRLLATSGNIWNTSNVTTMANMFKGATVFNQNIGGWNTAYVTNMRDMFDGASAFNQNIGGWNVANVTTMANMFANTAAMSTTNFDALLIGWAALPTLKTNVIFDAPLLNRTEASTAAVTTLSNPPYNWKHSNGEVFLPCFVAGTRILTPNGYVSVESLATGDHILTADGRTMAITWYKFSLPSTTVKTAPFRIATGALGPNLPIRDMYLSGQHMIKDAAGIWQKTQDLAVKTPLVTQYDVGKEVTYYHIECPDYFADDLVSEEVVVESYYRNWKEGTQLYLVNSDGFTRNYPQKSA